MVVQCATGNATSARPGLSQPPPLSPPPGCQSTEVLAIAPKKQAGDQYPDMACQSCGLGWQSVLAGAPRAAASTCGWVWPMPPSLK